MARTRFDAKLSSVYHAGDDDSDNDDLAGDARGAAAQAAYDRDRAARKARRAALAPVELAYEIDNTDAEQVGVVAGPPKNVPRVFRA